MAKVDIELYDEDYYTIVELAKEAGVSFDVMVETILKEYMIAHDEDSK